MKIFLDDIRYTPDHYDMTFRDGPTFISWLSENSDTTIDLISFDHDLGPDEITGYDVVKYIVNHNINVKAVQFHTSNPTGFKNMHGYFVSAKKAGLYKDLKINPHVIECIDGIETIMPYKLG